MRSVSGRGTARCHAQARASGRARPALRSFRAPAQRRRNLVCHQSRQAGNGLRATSLDAPVQQTQRDAVSEEWFRWDRHWWPVELLYNAEDADPARPLRTTLLGEDFVLWKTGGQWRAARDACPHRLAPMSEGRVDADGTLVCSYHGWRFSESGNCVDIPQADTEAALRTACSSPRSCLSTVPVRAFAGALWLWPDGTPEGAAVADATPPVVPVGFDEFMEYSGRVNPESTRGYTRLLPYGYDVLVENLADPSHIPVSHHKVMPGVTRDNATHLRMSEDAFVHEWGWATAQRDGAASATAALAPPIGAFSFNSVFKPGNHGHVEVRGPSLIEYRYADSADVREEKWISTVLMAVPVAPGRSRAFVFGWNAKDHAAAVAARSEAGGEEGGGTKSGSFVGGGGGLRQVVFGLLPKWIFHMLSHKIFDSDGVFLHMQDKQLRHRGGRWASAYYCPTSADKAIIAFRKWLDGPGGGGPQWAPGTPAADEREIPREVLLDRYTSHTRDCKVCKKASALRQSFMFVDWVHADVK
ncbi:unnamed protein product [Pedinophyceae sp. YPF-701]|nr:unnamed protein product [Pedinophyceae sp. YPF-701]